MRRQVFLIALFFTVNAGTALAVCLEPHPRVCAEFFRSDAVFVGTVVSVRNLPEKGEFTGGWVYQLMVKKMYRGFVQETIEVLTQNDSGRLPLDKGHTYLLFATKREGQFWIGGCGNSAKVTKGDDAIQEIEQVLKNSKSASGGNIRGRIVQSPLGTGKGIEGVPISVRGEAKTYSATTDKDGWFYVKVPAGKYSVTTDSLDWYVASYDLSYDVPSQFSVPNGGCVELQFLANRRN